MRQVQIEVSTLNKPGTALVMPGGGMRNVFVTGALIGADVRPINIDAVYCASSSIIIAVLFAAGQLHDTITLWRNYMIRPEVMSGKGLFAKADMFRVAELCFNMIDMDAFEVSRTKVFTNVLCLETGETHSIEVTRDNFLEVVQTTASLPFVTPKVKWLSDGLHYSDGAMHDNLPVIRAYEAGYRRLLVVRNQPAAYVMPQAPLWKRWLSYPNYPKARAAYSDRKRMFEASLDFIANPFEGVEVVMMLPDETTPATQMVRDPFAVIEAINLGIQIGERDKRKVRDLLLRSY